MENKGLSIKKVTIILTLLVITSVGAGCVEIGPIYITPASTPTPTPTPTPAPVPTIHALFIYYDSPTRERVWFTLTLYPDGDAIIVGSEDPYKPSVVSWGLYRENIYHILEKGEPGKGVMTLRLYPDNTCVLSFELLGSDTLYRGIWSYTPIPTPPPTPDLRPEPAPDLRFVGVKANATGDRITMTPIGTAVPTNVIDLVVVVNDVTIGHALITPNPIRVGETVTINAAVSPFAPGQTVRVIVTHVPTGHLLLDTTVTART